MIPRKIYYTLKSLGTVKYSRKEIEKHQKKLLEEIIDQSYSYFPTYRKLWDENGLDPDDFREIEDLREAPVTDRKTASKIDSSGVPGTVTRKYYSTGTTTGDVIEIPFEEQAADWTEAITLRTEIKNGYKPRNKIAEYWGLPQTKIGDILRPKTRIPADSTIEEQAEIISKENPDYLIYGAHILFRVAKHLESKDENFDSNIKKVFNNGELLTPKIREKIENVFDTTVISVYETAEFGQIGWECPDGGYHLNEDLVYTEILDKNGEPVKEGETGEMTVTSLVNHAFPLIRYRTGDLVVKGGSKCGCSTEFRKIEKIQGRKENVIENRKGEKVYPRQVIDVISKFDELQKFVFVKKSGEHTLKYKKAREAQKPDLEKLERDLKNLHIEQVKFKEVEEIDRINWKAAPVRNLDS
jgi:phenylacetate-CoA ligase